MTMPVFRAQNTAEGMMHYAGKGALLLVDASAGQACHNCACVMCCYSGMGVTRPRPVKSRLPPRMSACP